MFFAEHCLSPFLIVEYKNNGRYIAHEKENTVLSMDKLFSIIDSLSAGARLTEEQFEYLVRVQGCCRNVRRLSGMRSTEEISSYGG